MTTSDVPLFSMLRTRMRWHQERQKLLAENVANAETPGYRARDLRMPSFQSLVRGGGSASGMTTAGIGATATTGSPSASGISGVSQTSARHIPLTSDQTTRFDIRRDTGVTATPDGNRVNLEDEMMKVSQNQLDYQAVAGLYQRSLGLIRTAIGKRTG
ncbi:flagellar basal body rod protein FlgB [Phreatobacter sp.]|uniref:flagellar basal body rod protein FlgB n=1 Tax=Phreatobacter sp. TaxID=1966341 RepID=UPI003F715CDB